MNNMLNKEDQLALIQSKIYVIRGQKVMLDFDLAEAYGVETSQLKRQVRRNMERFEGDDFMIVLTRDELSRCQIGTLNIKRGHNIKYLPFAFTELDPLATYNRKKRTKTKFYFAKMGSGQKSLRLQVLQCFPIQTSSNWFIACSTISGSSVKMPASKLRVPSAFMPMPAPVRLALPIYASLPSKIIILK